MVDRLSPLDVSFLYLEEATTPDARRRRRALPGARGRASTTTGSCTLIEERIALVPRYRQKVRWVPGRIANPVWVDDEEFDVAYHVRRSALPRPGTRRAAARPGRPHHVPPARPQPAAVGDVPRRGALRRPVRDPHQDPPRDGRRRRRHRHRPGHPRRHARAAARRRPVDWTPRKEPSDVDLRRERRHRGAAQPGRRGRRACAPVRSTCARPPSASAAARVGLGVGGGHHGAAAVVEPAQRARSARPAGSAWRRCASTTSRRSAGTHGGTSTTSCSRSSRARCASG